MNELLPPFYFGLVGAATIWLGLLWAGSRFEVVGRSVGVKLGCGIGSVLLLFCPAAGLPLWKWAFSFCPNPSLPLCGIVCGALWRPLFGRPVLTTADWRAAWVFGAAAGSALYFQPFFFDATDLYFWGWQDDLAVWVTAALAVLFLCWGNRLGVLFIAALAARESQALESHNGWDYVVDPFYWLVASGVVATQTTRWWLEQRRRIPAGERTPCARY